jgi:methionine synthase II (cobalamin-independent)
MSEPKLNEALQSAIQAIVTINEQGHITVAPMSAPVTHGEFNRRMFLEAFLFKAGAGVSISPEDIKEYAAITDKEFPIILREYIDKGIIIKEDNVFDVEMYKLNMDINVQATP